jgi:hypothetical protein
MKNEIFESNPQLKEVHVTADGQCFYNDNDAKLHAKSLEDKKVELVLNPDHLEVVGEEIEEASKEEATTEALGTEESQKDAAITDALGAEEGPKDAGTTYASLASETPKAEATTEAPVKEKASKEEKELKKVK